MDHHLKALFGAWDQAIGTTLSAAASTPSSAMSETLQTNLDVLGNVMQATGSALVADSEKQLTLNKIGNKLQAIGNSTVVSGILIQFNTETATELNIKGSLLQSAGSAMSLPDLLDANEITTDELYDIYGNLLQAIGNGLQALSGIMELKGKEGQYINFAGSWIEAIGALILALIQSRN